MMKTKVELRYGGKGDWYAVVKAFDSGMVWAIDEVRIGDHHTSPETLPEVKKLRAQVRARARREKCKQEKQWGVEYWKYPC